MTQLQTTQEILQKTITFETLLQNLDSNRYYILSMFGLGDTYFLVAFIDALNAKYSTKSNQFIFIIKPTHQVILECFNYDSYIILQDLNMDKIMQSKAYCLTPQNGHIFPAHFHPLNKMSLLQHNFKFSYASLLNLDSNTRLKMPQNMPKISSDLVKKIKNISEFKRIVFYLPEANSNESLSEEIFNAECEILHNLGYKIIVNTIKLKERFSNIYVINLNLSLKDAIALSLNCAFTISIRSGFCDVIGAHCGALKIYYHDKPSLEFFSLKSNEISNFSYPQLCEVLDSDYYPLMTSDMRDIFAFRIYIEFSKKGAKNKIKAPLRLLKIYIKNKKQLLLKPTFSDLDSKKIAKIFLNTFELAFCQELINIFINPLNLFKFIFNYKKIKNLPKLKDILRKKLEDEWRNILKIT